MADFIISYDWLHKNGSNGYVGWTSRQLAVLGVSWPPRRGWLKKIIGKSITEAEKEEFERIGQRRRQQKDETLETRWRQRDKNVGAGVPKSPPAPLKVQTKHNGRDIEVTIVFK